MHYVLKINPLLGTTFYLEEYIFLFYNNFHFQKSKDH